MTVADLDRSIDFYTTVLSCQKISDFVARGAVFDRLYGLTNVQVRMVTLQLGEQQFELTEFLQPTGRAIPPDSRSNDRWFQHMAIVVSDMERAYQHLRHQGVTQTSPTPQTLPDWNPVAGGIQSFYFTDPDGHNLELIHFPADKGDPKWQSLDSLFLGIDHTALVVADSQTSRAFYCDLLGMKLEQESQNFGTEQEDLSGIANVRVQISSLKAPTGLGIELLEYIEPHHGRSIPDDTRVNDLWCWQTTISLQDPIAQVQRLQAAGLTLTSTEVFPVSGFELGWLIQDPDGHTIRIVDP